MKILLVRNDNIGDLINTTPAITALRKYYPSAQIDILVNTENQSAIFNNPAINQIYIKIEDCNNLICIRNYYF